MTKNIYDVVIIGSGLGGVCAAMKLSEKNRLKVLLIDLSKPPFKRRRFLEGYLGCFPSGDGKLYTENPALLDIVDKRRLNAANKWFFSVMQDIAPEPKLIKVKSPKASIIKTAKNLNLELELHPHYQWIPDYIHHFSRVVTEQMETAGNITFSFDNEVNSIQKKGDTFHIYSDNEEFLARKVILAAGRSGWRWVNKVYRDLGILVSDDHARFGLRVEMGAQYLPEFNSSHCTLKRDDLIIGPFNWHGTVIQEDHADMSISAFRSNESRWKSEKVSFSIIGKRKFENEGIKQTDRLAKLAFLLGGDRVGREKIKVFLKGNTQLNMIPEYNYLKDIIKELNDSLLPNLIGRGYFHFPDVITYSDEQISIGGNLETEIPGLFVIGESAGVSGLSAAGIMGAVAAESVSKD